MFNIVKSAYIKNSAKALVAAVMILGLWLTSQPAIAADEDLGSHRAWQAYKYDSEQGPVCVMWSKPTKSAGKYTRRGEIWLFVTHYPASNRVGEASMQMGYPLKEGRDISVNIDGKNKFTFYGEGETAFAQPGDDEALIRRFKAGSRVTVNAMSSRGTKTTDNFSLSGFTAAYQAISRACGIKG